MGIIVMVIFVAISCYFLILLNKVERFSQPKYDSRFTKGAVRGSLGRFTPKSTVEDKRIRLCKKNSKF